MDYKKQAFYNTVGNLVYMVCVWLISVLTVRLSGFEDAGVLSLAMSVGNIFYFIAMYGMRSFQASDSLYQYAPEDYFAVRWITTGISLVALAGYLLFAGYSVYICAAIVLYTLFKCAEACSDVFFGELQRLGHLEVCGISMSVKGILSIPVYCLILHFTKNINLALTGIVVLAALFFLMYDLPGFRKFRKSGEKKKATAALPLLKAGFPMLLTTVFPIIVTAMPRLALEHYCGTEVLGIYSSISTPTVLITTLVPNVLAPFMTHYGFCYHEKLYRKLLKMLWISIGCTALLGLAACICAYFLGDFVMGLIFGEAILPHLYLFIPLILATIVYAFSMCANSVLISIRQPAWLTGFAGAALVTSLMCSYPMVQHMGQMGAVWAFGIPFAIQLILQLAYLVYKLRLSRFAKEGK